MIGQVVITTVNITVQSQNIDVVTLTPQKPLKKICTKCLVEKSLEEFSSGSLIGTRLSRCKACEKERHAAYVKKNREKLNAYQREHRRKTGGYGVCFGNF